MFIMSLSDDYSWVKCEMKICVDVESVYGGCAVSL